MEDAGYNCINIHSPRYQNMRHRQWVGNIGLTATAFLPAVGRGGKLNGMLDILQLIIIVERTSKFK